MNMQFALLLIAGTAGGLLFAVLHISGGMMFGAVLAVLAALAAKARPAGTVSSSGAAGGRAWRQFCHDPFTGVL